MTPSAGERVGHRNCVFKGTAEPGIELVAAGRYPVTVKADGTWEATLVLNPGGNVALFTATDDAGIVSEVRMPVYYDPPLVLRADGLGPVDFHTPMESALATFIAVLGPPDDDHIVSRDTLPPELVDDSAPIHTVIGYVGREYARFVTWDSSGLLVMFSDYIGSGSLDDPPNFNGWISSDSGQYGAQFATAEGLGFHASVPELEAAYGDAFTWRAEQDDITGDWHFDVDSGIAWSNDTRHLYGRFDGDPLQQATRVSVIQAGFVFDEC